MSKIDKKTVCLALLIALLIFHIVNNIIFISIYPLAEGKDSYAHITAFNNFCQIIENGKLNPFYVQGKSLLHNLVFVVIDYPPFFYFSAFIFKLLFGGFPINAPILISTFYLLILLGAVYSIGERINPETGIIAAFVCGMYPLIFLPSRHFNLELMLCAIIAVAVLILLRTNYFADRKSSILLGVIIGFGMLTKQTFLIYIAGPFLVYVIYSFKNHPELIKKQKILNLIICAGFFLGISALFYLNKDIYKSIFDRAGFLGAISNDNLFSFDHLSYYFKSLRHTIGLFFTVVFLGALFFIKGIRNPLKWILVAWVCLPLTFLTFVILKYGEYTIAYLPAIALISAAAIANIRGKKLKFFLIGMVFFLGMLNYYNLTYARSVMFYSTYHVTNSRYEIYRSGHDSLGLKTKYSMDDVISEIGGKNHKIGIFYDFNGVNFPVYLIRCLFASANNKAQIVDFLFRSSAFVDNLSGFDIMIYITESQKKWTDKKDFTGFIQKFNSSFLADIDVSEDFIDVLVAQKKKFKLIAYIEFQTGDGHELTENVYIYKRKK